MNRKAILPALFTISLTGPIIAQRSGLGIKGGALMSTMYSEVQRSQWIPGGTLGLYAPIGIGARLEVQPELLITASGARFPNAEQQATEFRTLYINAPLTLKLFLNNNVNFGGGVQFGHRVLARQQDAHGTNDVTERFEPMDFGFLAALGYDLDSGVDLTVRGYLGHTPVMRHDDALFPVNRWVQLTVGYRFLRFKDINTLRRRH